MEPSRAGLCPAAATAAEEGDAEADSGDLSAAVAAFRRAAALQEEAQRSGGGAVDPGSPVHVVHGEHGLHACCHAGQHVRGTHAARAPASALLHEALAQLLDESGQQEDALATAMRAVEQAPQVRRHQLATAGASCS
eukprot:364584-Chlamydomonas_euryale.AAC.11